MPDKPDPHHYIPELGQASFGPSAWGAYAVPDYARALILNLIEEMDRVYDNVKQTEWNHWDEYDLELPGVEYHPYYWGDDRTEARKPNLSFAGVEIRWYKHPGRGLSCSAVMTPAAWAAWYERFLAVVQNVDHQHACGEGNG